MPPMRNFDVDDDYRRSNASAAKSNSRFGWFVIAFVAIVIALGLLASR